MRSGTPQCGRERKRERYREKERVSGCVRARVRDAAQHQRLQPLLGESGGVCARENVCRCVGESKIESEPLGVCARPKCLAEPAVSALASGFWLQSPTPHLRGFVPGFTGVRSCLVPKSVPSLKIRPCLPARLDSAPLLKTFCNLRNCEGAAASNAKEKRIVSGSSERRG